MNISSQAPVLIHLSPYNHSSKLCTMSLINERENTNHSQTQEDQEDIVTTSQSSNRQIENNMTSKVTINSDIPHSSTENPPVKSHCTPECTNKSRKNLIRCMHCMIWFHPKCVKEQNDYVGVFACFECRKVPQYFVSLAADMSDIMTHIRDLSHTTAALDINFEQMKESMNTEFTSLREANSELAKENLSLKSEIVSLKQLIQRRAQSPHNPNGNPSKSLLLGSSIIGDVQTNNHNELEVMSLPGAKFLDLKQKLDDLKTKSTKFETIHQSTANDVRATADSAVQISQKVIISSILPRADNSSAQLKAENVNINIKRMCDLDGKLSFCDNDCNFRLAENVHQLLIDPNLPETGHKIIQQFHHFYPFLLLSDSFPGKTNQPVELAS